MINSIDEGYVYKGSHAQYTNAAIKSQNKRFYVAQGIRDKALAAYVSDPSLSERENRAKSEDLASREVIIKMNTLPGVAPVLNGDGDYEENTFWGNQKV